MSRLLVMSWWLVPLLGLAAFVGPGRPLLEQDEAARLARLADAHAAARSWDDAVLAYQVALAALPEASANRLPLEVSLGRAQLMAGDILEAQQGLENALQVLEQNDERTSELASQARYELATADYYAAWYLRLQGATADEWKPEAERARGHFRLLAETSGENSELYQHSLEATIRLEQMDLNELLARPLPKNCPCCKQGLCQRKRKQAASRCNAPSGKSGEKKADESTRKSIQQSHGAGLNTSEGSGS